MERVVKEDVSVGSGIIATYNRMPQKLERVFAEFIDNTIQSYDDHRKELEKVLGKPLCKITITWNDNEIAIEDEAFGMDHEDFKRALKLNTPKAKYSKNSKSQYGMGLKIAAAYLGNWYSIDSTQYGNKEKYYSIIDIDEWKKHNPTHIDCNISDVKKNEHFTRIIIKKLNKKLTAAVDDSLRKKLAKIYSKDISQNRLEIIFNGKPIQSEDPELRRNTETDNEYLSYFEDSFEFNGEEFTYSGWIGILKTATVEDAGFTLSQYGRGIKLNYRPTQLFGKSNSFQYQRIVGEIQLDDPKWKISFNKDEFIWDDGLEKEFIKSLKGNKDIKEMMSIAGVLRKDVPTTPSVEQKDVKKTASKIEKKYEGLSSVKATVIKEPISDKPKVVIKKDEEVEPVIVSITWESIEYSFDIQVKNDNKRLDWFTLQRKDCGIEHAYYIVINGTSPYFAEYSKKECKDLIIDFAVTLALTQLSSERMGVDFEKSSALIQQLNRIIKYAKTPD